MDFCQKQNSFYNRASNPGWAREAQKCVEKLCELYQVDQERLTDGKSLVSKFVKLASKMHLAKAIKTFLISSRNLHKKLYFVDVFKAKHDHERTVIILNNLSEEISFVEKKQQFSRHLMFFCLGQESL